MNKINDPVHLKERANLIGEEAARWKKYHADAFSKLADGTTVIIDIVSGDFVTGNTWHAARDAFDQRFGLGDRFSHSFTVGRPTVLGGGLWRK